MKRSFPFNTFFAVPLMVLSAGFAVAATDRSDYTPQQALEFSQSAIGRAVPNYTFRDTGGEVVNIADFRGKPLIVSFIYTSCADSCPVITQTLADAVEKARDALGDDSFSVISIGFDSASDSPERMRYFANQHDIDFSGWKFLSGDLPSMIGLADDLGFIFFSSPKGYDHLSQVTVIDGGGVVYRQVYGQTFELPRLVEPLKELVFGTDAPFASVENLIKQIRLFCTIYDPAGDRYRFDYSIFIMLSAGLLIVGGLFVFLTREWLRIFRNRRRKPTPGQSGKFSA